MLDGQPRRSSPGAAFQMAGLVHREGVDQRRFKMRSSREKMIVAFVMAACSLLETGCTQQQAQAAMKIIPEVAKVATTIAQASASNSGNAGAAVGPAVQSLAQTVQSTNFQAGKPEAPQTLK